MFSMQTATNRGAANTMENGKFPLLNANSSIGHIPSSTSTPNLKLEHSSHGPMEGRSPPFTGPSPMFLHPHPLSMASGIHPTARGGGPMMVGQNHPCALGNGGATNFAAAIPFPMLLPFINQIASVNVANANANVKQEQKPPAGLATSRTPSSASSSNSAASCPSPAAAAAHSQLQQQHLHSLMAQFAPNPNAAAYCSSSSASPAAAAGAVVGGNTVGNWPSAIQQQLHHNFLLFQQQHLPKMPQQNPQRQSPKQQQQQPAPPTNGTTDPAMLAQQQQFLLQFFAALAASGSSNNPFVASNGRPFQMGVGGVLQQQYPNGGNNNNTGNFALQQLMNANKKLACDADGNAICPACKEPIGTNPAQLAKHLALERSRVQEALQNLKRKAQSRGNGQNSPAAVINSVGSANCTNLTGTAEEKQKREEILDGIRKKQQIRIQARRSGQFYMSSETLSKILADTENLSSPKGNSENGQNGSKGLQEPSNFGPVKDDPDANANEGEKMNKLGQICPECKIPSEFLVINVTSKAPVPFQCLECFQRQHHDRAQPSLKIPTGIDIVNGNNQQHNHVQQGRKRPSSTIVLATTAAATPTNGSGGGCSAFASALELANASPAVGTPKIGIQNNGGADDQSTAFKMLSEGNCKLNGNEQPSMDDGIPMKKAKFTAADEEMGNPKDGQQYAKVNGGMEHSLNEL